MRSSSDHPGNRDVSPEEPRSSAQAGFGRTGTEQLLAALWAEAIGSSDFSLTDNFFDIGGNSLRLIEVHSRLVRALRRPISTTILFEHPTIASLARCLEKESLGDAVKSAADRGRRQREMLARKALPSRE